MRDLKAIVNCKIWDGTGAPVVTNGVVLIEGSDIIGVGRQSETPVPEGTRLIDAGGGFAMPGLINAHDHLSWGVVGSEPISDTQALLNVGNARLALRAARNGANYLRSGVTTIRNMGDVDFVDLEYRSAFEENLAPGPRILASGPWLVTSHAWITFPGIPTCDGAEEVRKFVRQNLRAGVDLIKVFVGGELLGQCNTDPHLTYISREELETAIAEAHAKGKMVGAHILSSRTPGFRWAVETGIDVIEHGIWFTDGDFCLMRDKGIYLVMAGGRWFDGGGGERALRAYPNAPELLEQWYKRVFHSGVIFAVGVDGWAEVGALQCEIERLVRFGLSPQDALMAATRHGALVCGLEGKLGTLAVGKIADVLVLDGNPLVDITALRNVRVVMKSGKVYFC